MAVLKAGNRAPWKKAFPAKCYKYKQNPRGEKLRDKEAKMTIKRVFIVSTGMKGL